MSRKAGLLLLLACLWVSLADAQVYRYTAARSGLNMRESPSPAARVIGQIPYAERLQIGDDQPAITFAAENITGQWTRISYDGKTGYIFDGFLLPIPPPVEDSLETYVRNHLKLIAGPFIYKPHQMGVTSQYGAYTQSMYEKGVSVRTFEGIDQSSVTYCIPALTVGQAFVLCRLFPALRHMLAESEPFPLKSNTTNREKKIMVYKKLTVDGREYTECIRIETLATIPNILEIREVHGGVEIMIGIFG